jgi:hypothetical protein
VKRRFYNNQSKSGSEIAAFAYTFQNLAKTAGNREKQGGCAKI